jgi:hypothetical protein
MEEIRNECIVSWGNLLENDKLEDGKGEGNIT